MKAMISLKEGKSYTFEGYRFTTTPTPVTDAAHIAACKANNLLIVDMQEDAPLPPIAKKPLAAKPPAQAPDFDASDVVEEEPAEAPVAKKPGPRPGFQKKPAVDG